MDKELELLLDLITQGDKTDKRKIIGPDCVVYAQMRLKDDSIDIEVGTGNLIGEVFEREFGIAYTEALYRMTKQLGDVLRDFTYEIERIVMNKDHNEAQGGGQTCVS